MKMFTYTINTSKIHYKCIQIQWKYINVSCNNIFNTHCIPEEDNANESNGNMNGNMGTRF